MFTPEMLESIKKVEATRAARMGVEIRFDETARAPTFQYRKEGVLHEVWFEDARSLQSKMQLAESLGLGGLGIWNLLRPFSQAWALFSEISRNEGKT